MKHSKPILFSAMIVVLFTVTMIGGCKKEIATCTDGIQNQTETGIDCGGSCIACPTCSDGIQNQNETAIDCGGVCSACPCPYGYEGTNCTTEVRSKFLGQFQGPETCTVGNDNYILTITISSADIGKVIFSNVYNQAFNAIASVSGTSFTVASQTVATNVTVSGTGTISGNTLTFTYIIATSGGTNNTCTFVGVRQ